MAAKASASATPKLKRKLLILLVIAGILFVLLALRLVQVQLINGPEYQALAERQWMRRSNLTAQRGRILDRSGLVLAQSGTAYRVLVNPRFIPADERVRVAIELSDILGLNYDYVYERVSNTKRQQVQLKRQVESAVVDQLVALQLQLRNGVSFTSDNKRYYPFGSLFAQILGFTGIDGEGQTGIEAEYDRYLAGVNGTLVIEVDRKNQPLYYGQEDYIAPVPGYDLTLTVDAVMQSALEKYVEQCQDANNASRTSGLVIDPQTGEILAISTHPTFDLNRPPRDRVLELMDMSRNRIVTDTFEAGPIFALVTLAAALDSGAVTMDSTFTCHGSKTFRLEKLTCWKTTGHGKQTLAEAVENGCDCAFMEMAAIMGVDTLYDYIYAFGFAESTHSGVPGEDTGEVIHRKYIRESDLARVSFGQTITCTGIQIARAYCAAINGGILMQPYIVDAVATPDGRLIEKHGPMELKRVIRSATSTQLRAILQSVVDKGGASNAGIIGYAIGGNTGTSRKFEDDGSVSRTRMLSSFVGFMPVEAPKILALFIIDEPQAPMVYGSMLAAPWAAMLFTDLAQYYGMQPNRAPGETDTVPNLMGETGERAKYVLERDGFACRITDSDLTGTVIRQIPAAGSKVRKGSIVLVYTTMTTYSDEGMYREMVQVPGLIGRRRQDAFDILATLGLRLSFDPAACIGLIISQSIEEGTRVEPGTEIFVVFEPTEAQKSASAAQGNE